MTQPEQAVGGDNAPVDAKADALNAFDEIAAEAFPDDDEEEQPAEAAEGEQPEASEEAEDDADLIEEEDELPPIDAPNSLTAEEKEAFKKLPRDAQEFTARRIGDLEKGFQTKAQEVAREKQALQHEAIRVAEQIKAQAAEQLQRYAEMFDVRPPSAALFQADPVAYAQQLEAYQHNLAQREQAQRDAEAARAEQAQLSAAREQHEAELFHQRLEAELPELLDPANGQSLAKELNATAELLGFDPNQISDVTAIKALKLTSEWKSKADKYDGLMRKKMERVRAGKNPPPIAKPGTARSPDQNRAQRAEAAWQTATSAKSRSVKDQALADWMENSGWL